MNLLAAAFDPERWLAARQRALGDPFRLRVPGLGEVLFTGHPEGARAIFQAPAEHLAPPRPNPIEPLLGPRSLILLDGDRHRRERRLLLPPFHGERMRAYARIIADATADEVATWRPGGAVDAGRAAQAITLQVIVRAIFGIDEPARRAAFARTIAALLDAYTTPLLLVPALRRRFAGLGPFARFARRRARFDALLSDEIAKRRRDHAARDDILSLLLAARHDDGAPLSDDDLLDELRTLLVAGHETTATAVAWTLFHVHHDPALRSALLDELATGADDLPRLPLLGAVCAEALRLHPVVPVVLRHLGAPLRLRGVDAPAGSTVGIAVPLLHAHLATWSEPARFDPTRFLDRKPTPFEYAPFGGGHRRCVGAAFATTEQRIVVGTVLALATLALSDRDRRRPPPPAVPRSITFGPRRPIVLGCVAVEHRMQHPGA